MKEVTIEDSHPERSEAKSKDPALGGTGSLTAFGMTENGWITKTDGALTVSLNTAITPKLQKEGLVRELTRQINDLRKKVGLTPSDTVEVMIATADPILRAAVKDFQKQLRKAVLAKSIKPVDAPQETDWSHELELDTHEQVWIGMRKV